ncbi:hypothetical protein AX17_007534 [Amanita inopinata Kibby_2008]|nr:hypothetical protein AX17_007534 [Amanita inopinata Kibby_2008]
MHHRDVGAQPLQHRRLVKRQADATSTAVTATTAGAVTTGAPGPAKPGPSKGAQKDPRPQNDPSDGLGGILGPVTDSTSMSMTSEGLSTSSTVSATSSMPNTSAVAPVQSSPTSLSSAVVQSSTLSSIQSSSTTDTSATATSTSSSSHDSGPIVGGIFGGLFAVAAVVFFVGFLLRRWRRRQIDKEIFDATEFRSTAVNLDDSASQPTQRSLRPPTMIERHMNATPVPGQRTFAGADPAMFNNPNSQFRMQYDGGGGYPGPGGYGMQQQYYPPQAMQGTYYPQQQQVAYNQQMYGYGVPLQTPVHAQAPVHRPGASLNAEFSSDFGPSRAASPLSGSHDLSGTAAGVAVTRERRQSGLSTSSHGHGRGQEEGPPAYDHFESQKQYVDMQRDFKTGPSGEDAAVVPSSAHGSTP